MINLRDHKLDFEEADRRYADLKRQLDERSITPEEFDRLRLQLMVKDEEGCWWAKGRKKNAWYYHSESGWVQGTPPGYQPQLPSQASSADHTWGHHQALPTRNEQSIISFSDSQPQDEHSPVWQIVAKLRRKFENRSKLSIGLVSVGVLLAVVLLAGVGVASAMGSIDGTPKGTSEMGAPSLPDTQSESSSTEPSVATQGTTKEENEPNPPAETLLSPAPSASESTAGPTIVVPAAPKVATPKTDSTGTKDSDAKARGATNTSESIVSGTADEDTDSGEDADSNGPTTSGSTTMSGETTTSGGTPTSGSTSGTGTSGGTTTSDGTTKSDGNTTSGGTPTSGDTSGTETVSDAGSN